jgi:hypothetical protein
MKEMHDGLDGHALNFPDTTVLRGIARAGSANWSLPTSEAASIGTSTHYFGHKGNVDTSRRAPPVFTGDALARDARCIVVHGNGKRPPHSAQSLLAVANNEPTVDTVAFEE